MKSPEIKHKSDPDPVDLHVGKRLRLRRQMMNISQETLANDIDLTFQQVQKYESGYNRISASRLYHIAAVLKVTPSYFFDGLPETAENAPPRDPMQETAALELVARFNTLDPTAQKPFLEILHILAPRRMYATG